ncbi:MAG TPA: dihydroorotate dehydrogenase [Nitrososphaeraceae archaeon]|nr:dihydroorotate dehydrogenase [Nitrososphaeraceae archaeon]
MKGEKQSDTLSVNVGPMRLRNPTMLASGILGISQDIFERLYNNNIGAIVTKSISVDPMKGYANPTIVPLGNKTYLNAVGLSNPGVYAFSHEIMRNKFVPIVVSLVGSSEKDFPKMISFLDSLNVIGYEINLSCPHVSKMGMEIGDDPEMVSLIIRTIKRHTRKPISVKIGIGSMDVVEIARVAVESGADMITAINTVRAMKIDVQSMIPVLSNVIGGLSGKAIKPIGIRCVYEISKVLNVPVIGCGGVSSWEDVVEYMIAGASAVQIGSILGNSDDTFFNRITSGLKRYLARKGIKNIGEIVGLAHRY